MFNKPVEYWAVLIGMVLYAASRDAEHIAGLFGRKLDDVDAGFGIELARLRHALECDLYRSDPH